MKLWRDIKDLLLSFYYPKGQYFLLSFPKKVATLKLPKMSLWFELLLSD